MKARATVARYWFDALLSLERGREVHVPCHDLNHMKSMRVQLYRERTLYGQRVDFVESRRISIVQRPDGVNGPYLRMGFDIKKLR